MTQCREGVDSRLLGSAHVEADHFTLAPSLAGQLIWVGKQEGDSVQAGELIALIDTLPLHFQRLELLAGHTELQASLRAKSKEAEAIRTEAGGVARDLERIGSLVKSGSAPEQQADRLQTNLASARERQQAVQAGAESIKGKEGALNAKLAWLDEQLQRCRIRSVVTGRVITRYRNTGEMASPSQPVYELSRADTLRADFFIPQPMLSQLTLGQKVFWRLDTPDGQGEFVPAAIQFFSDEAEFAPKNTQTRESRNELVFQVRSVARNASGTLKSGMPIEVWRDTAELP